MKLSGRMSFCFFFYYIHKLIIIVKISSRQSTKYNVNLISVVFRISNEQKNQNLLCKRRRTLDLLACVQNEKRKGTKLTQSENYSALMFFFFYFSCFSSFSPFFYVDVRSIYYLTDKTMSGNSRLNSV